MVMDMKKSIQTALLAMLLAGMVNATSFFGADLIDDAVDTIDDLATFVSGVSESAILSATMGFALKVIVYIGIFGALASIFALVTGIFLWILRAIKKKM